MVPPINIPTRFGIIIFNMDLFVFSLILFLIYRRYSHYIIRMYNFDRAPKKQNKFAYSVINIVSILFIIISLILIVSVDSK
jgi:hypothetical protein